MPITKKKAVSHRDVCRAVASLRAYLRLGNQEKSEEFAWLLMRYMQDLGLLKIHNHGTCPTCSSQLVDLKKRDE